MAMGVLVTFCIFHLTLQAVWGDFCPWSQWKCSPGLWKNSRYQCPKMFRDRSCCGEPCDGMRKETAPNDQWKDMGLNCPVLKYSKCLTALWCCPEFAEWDLNKFPTAQWCPWNQWTSWKVDCTHVIRELAPKKVKNELEHVTENGIHVRIRKRECECPSRPGGCNGDEVDLQWNVLRSMEAKSCVWCTWNNWGPCRCLSSSVLPRLRYRRCVCPDGSLKYAKDEFDVASVGDKDCASEKYGTLYSGNYEMGPQSGCSFSSDCPKKPVNSWSSDEATTDFSDRKTLPRNPVLVIILSFLSIALTFSVFCVIAVLCYRLKSSGAARQRFSQPASVYMDASRQSVFSQPYTTIPSAPSADLQALQATSMPPPSYEECMSAHVKMSTPITDDS